METIVLKFEKDNQAIEFQRRLYIFRQRVKEAGEPDWGLLYRVKASRKSNILTLQPYDKEFDDVLAQAGFAPPPALIHDPLAEEATEEEKRSILDEFMPKEPEA